MTWVCKFCGSEDVHYELTIMLPANQPEPEQISYTQLSDGYYKWCSACQDETFLIDKKEYRPENE